MIGKRRLDNQFKVASVLVSMISTTYVMLLIESINFQEVLSVSTVWLMCKIDVKWTTQTQLS